MNFTEKLKEAIHLVTVNHGWEMAILGGLIVFSGLVLLSFAISQFHKFLPYWEKREDYFRKLSGKPEKEEPAVRMVEKPLIPSPDHMPLSIVESAELYKPLIDLLSTPFQLQELYRVSSKNKFPHPHLTIKNFREAGILVQDNEGNYTWNA